MLSQFLVKREKEKLLELIFNNQLQKATHLPLEKLIEIFNFFKMINNVFNVLKELFLKLKFLDHLQISPSNDSLEKAGNFSMTIGVSSILGSTGLISETVESKFDFFVEAKAEVPNWNILNENNIPKNFIRSGKVKVPI